MKIIRIAVAVAMVCFLVFTWYSSMSSVGKSAAEFNYYVSQGDQAVEKAHYQEAYIAYQNALSVSSSTEIQNKILDAYEKRYNETGSYSDLENLKSAYQSATGTFPKSSAYYEKLIKLRVEDGEYKEALSVYTNAANNSALNDEIKKYYHQIKYSYKIQSTGYLDYIKGFGNYYAIENYAGWSYVTDDFDTSPSLKYITIGPIGEDGIFYTEDSNGKTEFVDLYGIVRGKVDENIEKAGIYSNGLTPVQINGKYYYIDLDGNRISGPYEFASTYINNLAAVEVSENKWKIIDAKGNAVSDTILQDVVLDESGCCLIGENRDRIIAKNNDVYSVYKSDLSGKINDFNCDKIDIYTSDELIATKANGKWGFSSIDGKVAIEPQYNDAKSFSNGLAAVSNGTTWSLIDRNSNEVVKGNFTDISYVTSSGRCLVKIEQDEKNVDRDYYDVLQFNFNDLLNDR